MRRASVTGLLSLTPCHTGGGLRCAHNPCPFRWDRTPWPPSTCARLPRWILGWLDLYEEGYPLPVFAFDLSVLRARGPRCSSRIQAETLNGRIGESSFAAYCGMHVTPDYCGKSVPPDRLPSCIGTPLVAGGLRYGEPFHSNLADGIRTMSSRTPAPSRASFQMVTGLKPPGVLGLHATPVAVASQSAR
jgi:hypothetical protein